MNEQQIVDQVCFELSRSTRFIEAIQATGGVSYLEAQTAVRAFCAPLGGDHQRRVGLFTICLVAACAAALGRGNRLLEDARARGMRPHTAIIAAEAIGRRIHWKAA